MRSELRVGSITLCLDYVRLYCMYVCMHAHACVCDGECGKAGRILLIAQERADSDSRGCQLWRW